MIRTEIKLTCEYTIMQEVKNSMVTTVITVVLENYYHNSAHIGQVKKFRFQLPL